MSRPSSKVAPQDVPLEGLSEDVLVSEGSKASHHDEDAAQAVPTPEWRDGPGPEATAKVESGQEPQHQSQSDMAKEGDVARERSRQLELRKLVRRHQRRVAACCLVTLGVIGGLVGMYISYINDAKSGGKLTSCSPGYYCIRETFQFPCPGGRFGNSSQLSNSTCTGSCEAGYYCPEASTSPTEFICPEGAYCPEGSASPTLCPAGTFGSATRLSEPACSGECAPGYYCPEGSTTATQVMCPLGNYCPRGTAKADAHRCPLGTYNDRPGLTSIDDCPTCEAAAGNVCAPGSSSSPSDSVIPCPEGHYCPGTGLPIPCPAGTFGNENGLSTLECSGVCPAGQWCAEGTIDPFETPCPAGFYCPAGATNYSDFLCWEGYVCVAGTQEPYLVCPQGSYCPEGSGKGQPCPGGTFGFSEGLIHANCSGICPSSYYCEPGTVIYYEFLCPPGSYCPAGTSAEREFLCPAGKFSAYTGLKNLNQCFCDTSTDPECALRGTCAAGYYCPAGSGSARQYKCPFNYYCPESASEPLLCEATGFYCLERAHSPYAYENSARMMILETLSEKAWRWQTDTPVSAQQYLFQGYTLEEAFMVETYKSTYNGLLYGEVRYVPVRGLDEVNVNVTTYGFFAAGVHICDVNKGIDNPVTLEQIGEIDVPPARSANDTYIASALFRWEIPRDAIDGEMVICLRMPQGNRSQAIVVSDIFEIAPPYIVPPLRHMISFLLLAIFGLVLLVTAPCALLNADRSREGEVHALIKNPSPHVIRLLSRLQRIIEPAQLLTLVVWNPSIKHAGGAAEAVAFWWCHLVSVILLPMMGFITASMVAGGVLVFALSTDVVLGLFKLERRRAELTCASRILAFEVLYVPILLTLLAPLDCAYTDPEADDAYYEYPDQVVMRYFFAADLECWHSPMHVIMAVASLVLAPAFYLMSLRYARENGDKDLQHLSTVTRYRVIVVLLKTVLCFESVQLEAIPGQRESLGWTISAAIFFLRMFHEVRRMQPVLGRAAIANDVVAGSYLLLLYTSIVMAGISSWHGLIEREARTTWPLFVACCALPVPALVGMRLNHRTSRAQIEACSFQALSTSPASSVRERVLSVTLDFLLSVYNYESPRMERVEAFVHHLGDMLATEPLARDAVTKLLAANAPLETKVFSVCASDLSTSGRSGPARIPLCGTPEQMLGSMMESVATWNLSGQTLQEPVIVRIASVIRNMRNLHTIQLGRPGPLSHETFRDFLDALGASRSLMHFQMTPPEKLNVLEHGARIGRLLRERAAAFRADSMNSPLTRFDCGAALYLRFFIGHDKSFFDASVSAPEERSLLISLAQGLTLLSVKITKRTFHALEDPRAGLCAVLCEACQDPALFAPRMGIQIRVTSDHTTHVGFALKQIGASYTLLGLYLNQARIADAETAEIDVKDYEKNSGSVALVEGLLSILQNVRRVSIPQHESDEAAQSTLCDAASRIGTAVAGNPAMQALNVGFGDLDVHQIKHRSETISFVGNSSLSDAQAFALMPIVGCNKDATKVEIHGLLQGRMLTDLGTAVVCRGLEPCQALQKLALGDWKSGNYIGSLCLASLGSTTVLDRLESLDLRRCGIQPNIASGLANLLLRSEPARLRSLKLSMNPIGDMGLEGLSRVLARPDCAISKLHLAQCAFTREGFHLFCGEQGLQRAASLRVLVLDGNASVDVESLASAFCDDGLGAQLETLTLADCELGNVEPLWRAIAAPEDRVDDPPRLPGLIKLNLSENPQLLLPTLVLPCLENLSVQRCNLSDQDANRICTALELHACPRLRGLDLSRNEFSDDVAFRMAKAFEKRPADGALSAVCLADNKFSEECLDIIRRLCPPSIILDL